MAMPCLTILRSELLAGPAAGESSGGWFRLPAGFSRATFAGGLSGNCYSGLWRGDPHSGSVNLNTLTGGPNGISGIPKPTLFGLEFARKADEE